MSQLDSRLRRYRNREILTPMVDTYLRGREGPVFGGEIATQLARMMSAEPRNRSGHFSASNLADCLRKQSFQYWGFEDESLANAAQQALYHEGHWRHLRWQGIFLEMGLVIALEDSVSLPELELQGTIDAILDLKGAPWIIDIKGVNPFLWPHAIKGEFRAGYNWQMQVYMMATGIENCMLWMENKATHEYAEYQVLPDPKLQQQIVARLAGLRRFRDLEQLPKVLPDFPKATECKQCQFRDLCSEGLKGKVDLRSRVGYPIGGGVGYSPGSSGYE